MAAPAAYKYTMIFKYVSGGAIGQGLNLAGSWSESVYYTTYSTVNFNAFQTLAVARCSILGTSAFISGLRVQGVDPSSGANTSSVHYVNPAVTSDFYSDIPQMALLLRARSSTSSNVRSMRLAGIPDSQVSYGEYVPSFAFKTNMAVFLSLLNGWKFRAQDLSQPTATIKTIDGTGNVVLNGVGLTLAVNGLVKVKRTTDAFGNLKGGTYAVQSITSATQFQLQKWNLGPCTNGTMQNFVIIYPTILTDNNTISRVVPRKVGRPSLGYRGRRSKKRA